MTRKHKDLQPWLDYFDLLRTYEQNGFLEVMPDKHEAYITQPALHALSDGDNPEQLIKDILETLNRIHTYAGWKSQEGMSYLQKNFALHVVKEQEPHDLLYTLLLTMRRRWWWPWRRTEHIETIMY